MAEEFQDIKWEILYTDTWVDVSSDVLANPTPKGAVGILNNGYLDLTQDGNSLTFSLNNSDSNSQGTLGYYSTLSPANLVRLSFMYDNRRVYKFLGYIPPEGVNVHAGVLGDRRVDVTCRDWFGLINEYRISDLAYTTNKSATDAIELLLDILPDELRPYTLGYAGFNSTLAGYLIFVDLFDLTNSGTTVIAELNKMATSEIAWCYLKPREDPTPALYYWHAITRRGAPVSQIYKTPSETTSLFLLANGTDRMLLADGSSKLLLTDLQEPSFTDADIWTGRELEVNTGDNYANRSKTSLIPRVRDADATTSIIWSMESYIKVAAGQSISGIVARYRNPDNRINKINCIAGTQPVANTDYKAYANSNGTGTDLTANLSVSVDFATAEAFITLTNTGGTDLYTGGENILFQLRGQGVYVYDTVDFFTEATSAFAPYDGERSIDISIQCVPADINQVKEYLPDLLAASVQRNVTIRRYPLIANRDKKNMMAFMHLDVGEMAAFSESVSGYDANSYINGYEFEILPSGIVAWSPCLFRYDDVPNI